MSAEGMISEAHTASHMSDESRLYTATIKGNWEEVVKIYEQERETAWLAEITSAKDMALHMAINEEREDIVEKLVAIIESFKTDGAEKALKAQNESGDTPLHRAATRGSVNMCDCIVKAAQSIMDVKDRDRDRDYLFTITNNWGQNPVFVAALDNRKQVFFYLIKAAAAIDPEPLLRNAGSGDTVLHSAIKREHYDLAFHMIKRFPDQLLDKCNAKGMTPLHVLANKPPAFRSGYHLSWWKKIIYYSISVEPLKYDADTTTPKDPIRSKQRCPENYLICSGGIKTGRDPENPNSSDIEGNIPQNYGTCFEFLATVFLNFLGALGFGMPPSVKNITYIIKARQTHTWSEQILDELLKDPAKGYMNKNAGSKPPNLGEVFGHDHLHMSLDELKKNRDEKEIHKEASQGDHGNKDKAPERTDTALVVAAQKGVVEVVNKILQQLPLSIHDTSSMKNKNIVLVAAENRQPLILDTLSTRVNQVSNNPKLWEDLIRAVDSDENTILHLAANYDETVPHVWQTHGAALHMQQEVKWYEYVKSLLPPHFLFLGNKNDKTPLQIFTEKHDKLVKDSSEWLKDTSESCSVVAALVAGVSFATSSQVPGGTNDQGKPNLEGKYAFELFGVTALVGLCFSVTALIMFLSILTSRKQPKDFKSNLPRRLLLGLSSLFVSIVSMLISFCAAHFFVLEDKFKNGVFPLYAATCLPVSLYAIAQFPLYLDLLKAIVTRVPQSHHFSHL